MSIIYAPYHLDEFLPELSVPVPAGHDITTVVEELPEGGDVWSRLLPLYSAVADVVSAQVLAGACPAVISGDCTTSIATMAGLQRAGVDAAVVWFDAHGDVQTLETTASGYIGGMPLRILLGYRPELLATPLGLRALPENRALLVGARDLDPPEVEYLARASVTQASVEAVDESALPAGPLLLHLDLDVLDCDAFPGLRYPVTGGPHPAGLVAAVSRLRRTGRVAAIDIACTWHPGRRDDGGQRASLIRDLLA